MQARLEACYFLTGDDGQRDRYERLARVLEFTARRHAPSWLVNVEQIDSAPLEEIVAASKNPSHEWNTLKLEWWRDRVRAAPDGAPILLIDGDCFLVRPLDDIWSRDFDVALTWRDRFLELRAAFPGLHGGIPFNAGVVFLRATPGGRAFVERWAEINARLLRNGPEHEHWRKRYAGMNQAALGCLLEEIEAHERSGDGAGLKLTELPCSEWNLCNWETYDPEVTRIVHVKSRLRRSVFNMPAADRAGNMKPLRKLWLSIERAMLDAAGKGN